MRGIRSAELVATEKVGGQVADVKAELLTWGRTHGKILDTEEQHTEMLGQILKALQPAPSDGDPIGDLIRHLLETLQRVENKVDALARLHPVG